MKNNIHLVSVITPTYNREKYVEEVIISVLNQDYPNIEYIVLNDGSTDNSLEIIKKYKDRITYSTHDNMGETLTVNKGLKIANGDIIGIVNLDDPLYPNTIRNVVKYLTEYQNIDIVYPDWDIIDKYGQVIQNIKTYDYDFVNMVSQHHCLPKPGAFFKKELLEKLKGRDISYKYIGEFDFWLRAGLIGNFIRVPYTLATFRQYKESTFVDSKGYVMAQEHIKLINKFYCLHNLPDEIIKVKKEARSNAYYYAFISLGKNNFFIKILYIFISIFFYPKNYLSQDKTKLKLIPFYLFPKFLFIILRKIFVIFKKIKNNFKKYFQ